MGLQRVAVVGAGWAGLAAAVHAVRAGHQVVLSDMAPAPGGRARSRGDIDNGQHILIGAYRETLALMRAVGVDPHAALHRLPLALVGADGQGLRLPQGNPAIAFVRGVLGARGWGLADRLSLLRCAWRWRRARFDCSSTLSVAQLASGLSAHAYREMIEPLCIAALNTPPEHASAKAFLRVLQDALFGGRGGSDLLLPQLPLSNLLPEPAIRWLQANGAECRFRRRALRIEADGGSAWRVDGERFDALVLACTAAEAARLVAPVAPDWSRTAAALRHESILTVVLHAPGLRLPFPMVALATGPGAPAQFAFDLGQLGRTAHEHAFVVSSAGPCLTAGVAAAAQVVLRQARVAFPGAFDRDDSLRQACAERRATFACTPALQRPTMHIAPNLHAAGDYVEGPYPATIEGAVRSGLAAAQALA